jgi:hypothetical protein
MLTRFCIGKLDLKTSYEPEVVYIIIIRGLYGH